MLSKRYVNVLCWHEMSGGLGGVPRLHVNFEYWINDNESY